MVKPLKNHLKTIQKSITDHLKMDFLNGRKHLKSFLNGQTI